MTRKALLVAALAAIVAAVGLAVALLLRPGESGPAVEAYTLFLGAIGAALVTRATSHAFPAATGSGVAASVSRRRRTPERVVELTRIERELEMSMQSAYDSYYRLRPVLRELAEARLSRRGVELDAGGRAEELLGPDAWAIVRPDLPRPTDHHAAGVRVHEVERAIASLEALGP